MARLTKVDWLEKGLNVLSVKGYNNLRLEYLCEQLKVTRGSFYHHFEDIHDYIDKLMEFWEDNSNVIMDGVAKSGGAPLERLNRLQGSVFDISARLEVVVRAWATFNKTVLKYVRRIDKKRIAFISELYVEEGYPAKAADTTARIEYAAYVGIQNLYFTDAKKEDTAGLFRELERVLIRFGKDNIGMGKG
ncbi:MAG: AcrR family transcriptional regulator [Limisphaerales bacterium]|jgi:AcrR family transcriptional regulator